MGFGFHNSRTGGALAGFVTGGTVGSAISDPVTGGAVIAGGVITGSIAGSAGSVRCSISVGYLCGRITYLSVAWLPLQHACFKSSTPLTFQACNSAPGHEDEERVALESELTQASQVWSG